MKSWILVCLDSVLEPEMIKFREEGASVERDNNVRSRGFLERFIRIRMKRHRREVVRVLHQPKIT